MIDTTRSTLNNGVLSGSESQIINHYIINKFKHDVMETHEEIFDELVKKHGFIDDTVGMAYIDGVCSFTSLADKNQPKKARICTMVNGNYSELRLDISSINQVLDILKLLGVNIT